MLIKDTVNNNFLYRRPIVSDAAQIYNLVKKSKILDVNSEYMYALLGLHFAKTSIVVECNNKIIGFVCAYLTGRENNILFIWQIAIDESYRKRGVALKALNKILRRNFVAGVKYLHLTISPSNISSLRLFETLAKNLNVKLKKRCIFDQGLFSQNHEREDLFIIGPIN